MNDIVKIIESDENIHRMERPAAIAPGSYWRCLRDVEGIMSRNEKYKFEFYTDCIYLITGLEFFDGKLHSIVFLNDPSQGDDSGLLTLKLLNENFDWVSDDDAKQFREAGIAKIMSDVAKLQSEISEAQVNQDIMASIISKEIEDWEAELARCKEQEENTEEESSSNNADNLPALSVTRTGRFDLSGAVTSRIGAQDIAVFAHMAKREGKIAEVKGKWLTDKVEVIARTMKKLSPFYAEYAALGLARASDAMHLAKEVEKGLRSLRLYTGEGVQVVKIMEGKSASYDEPLTLYQRKLFVDEEFAVWTDVDRLFDYTRETEFFEALSENEDLRQQLIPAQRGVLSMAVRRSAVKYDVKSIQQAFESMSKNRVNQELFLLIRDGDNWYRVYSDEPSHELSPRLFPTNSEMGDIFKGVDGEKVGFEDLRFSHRANEFERLSLAYKRFLILICGLDHRLQLFGTFYPSDRALNFISLQFQSEYMHFICDDEGDVMLGDTVGNVSTFISDNHAQLVAGSRVLVFSRNLIQHEAAPGAFSSGYYENRQTCKREYTCLVEPQFEALLLTVRRQKDDLVVDLPVVRKDTWRELSKTHFNVRVALNKLDGRDLSYLITETLDSSELRPFIYNRRSRAQHLNYIYGFKLAIKLLTKPEAEMASVSKELREMAQGTFALSDELASRAAIATVQAWRLKNITADYLPLPGAPEYKLLTDELAAIAWAFKHSINKVDKAITNLGGKLLRLMRGKRGSLIAYYDQPESERDLRIHHWRWVGRRVFTAAGKISDDVFETVILPKGRIFGEAELFSCSDVSQGTMESQKRITHHNSLLSDFTTKINTATAAVQVMSTAFSGYRKGISEHAWLLLTTGKSSISSIKYGRRFAFPIGLNTDNGIVIVVEADLLFMLQFYGSDAQRAMVATWIESEKTIKQKSKSASVKDNIVHHVIITSDRYWGTSKTELIDHDHHRSSFGRSNVHHYVQNKVVTPNEALNNFMGSKDESRHGDSVHDYTFLDPNNTWFAPECFAENGQFAVNQFFPDFPFQQEASQEDHDADSAGDEG